MAGRIPRPRGFSLEFKGLRAIALTDFQVIDDAVTTVITGGAAGEAQERQGEFHW
jgi:hypothetical protein